MASCSSTSCRSSGGTSSRRSGSRWRRGASRWCGSGRSATFPARFTLVAAMNPCPCGQHGAADRACSLPAGVPERYLRRVSGPLRDRIDLWVAMDRVPPAALLAGREPEPSAVGRAGGSPPPARASARGAARRPTAASAGARSGGGLRPRRRDGSARGPARGPGGPVGAGHGPAPPRGADDRGPGRGAGRGGATSTRPRGSVRRWTASRWTGRADARDRAVGTAGARRPR